ncbi:MAG TPA: PQQ-binding-like beta-propeller repeat protein, partial [Ilumatobacteraceae bacterium]|nr:PQQ-binding-like beta-propeller repeat protein [Ilumatobacteraceae bacterium]
MDQGGQRGAESELADGVLDDLGHSEAARTEEGYGYYALTDGDDPDAGYGDELTDAKDEGNRRVPFAERNWRVPTVSVLLIAIVVIGVVIVLLPNDGRVDRSEAAVGSFRDKPKERVSTSVAGTIVALETNDDSIYVLSVVNRSLRLVSLDRSTGDERWNVSLEALGGARSSMIPRVVGDLWADADSLAVVSVVGAADPRYRAIDAESGAVTWSAQLREGSAPAFERELLVSTRSADGVTVT